MQNLPRVDKNFDPILSRMWTKVHKILDDVAGPSHFQTSLPDATFRSGVIRRYVSKSSKTEQM